MLALMTADPTDTPVTRPVLLTVATAALLLCQVTVRPGIALPSESRTVAVSCCVPWTTTNGRRGRDGYGGDGRRKRRDDGELRDARRRCHSWR